MVQLALSDPFAFANVGAFGEILALEHDQRAALYATPDWRSRAHTQMREAWGDILDFAVVSESDAHPELIEAATLGEMAAERGLTSIDVMVEVALADDLGTRFTIAMINDNEDEIAALLADDHFLLGLSDAGAHTSQLCDADAPTHLLGHWCRERGTLSLEDAVWRLTGHPAHVYGFTDRGRIAPGFVADLVAFDPATVGPGPLERRTDLPTGADRLVARAHGIEHIWVAGTAIDHTGEPGAGPAPGRLLRGGHT